MKRLVDELVVHDPDVMVTIVRALENTVPEASMATGYEVECREGIDRDINRNTISETPVFYLRIHRIETV